ncbi:G protein gamma subunit [Phycomyces blakesleeanus]|uniref:Guanine nucleotide-binding protein subunit gamma n=2 Tax=Phycomyces blakesleeanus TaxID=4837 RepID=A0A162NHE9_PHYB8|nr:G protein gamma subunit [Phycomyces blakesleeanus NRRL 1555(-)]OAD69724.1 G protein gamma subunit [Phycomyces blakesleeanus NRRL 1555(-)]|eukprot:XP_018287764.1 G protein gamma subunit [Phycomyces blakesleeanus NRRL 1555(-)]
MQTTHTSTAARQSQDVSASKLKRLLDHNEHLKDQLNVPRTTVSEAATRLVDYCNSTKDPLVPSVWGAVDKKEDPYGPTKKSHCCTLM